MTSDRKSDVDWVDIIHVIMDVSSTISNPKTLLSLIALVFMIAGRKVTTIERTKLLNEYQCLLKSYSPKNEYQ